MNINWDDKSIKKFNERKEQIEVIIEIKKVNEYRENLKLTRYTYNKEIQEFINDTIDKYREKIEVRNFYNSPHGLNEISNQYDTLNLLEEMIFQYTYMKAISSN